MHSSNLQRGQRLIEEITSSIQQLSTNVVELESLVDKIGGPEDTFDTKESLNYMVQNSNGASKRIKERLKDLIPLSNEQREFRVPRERLVNEYMNVLNRLQAVQRRAASKEKAQIRSVTDEEEKLNAETLPDPLQQMQVQEQRRHNIQELKERHEALNQLETDISDVNQIFKDLARIVHDQGEMVDSIEANVEHASVYVQEGATNVQQALHYQSKARQKRCLLLVFLIALILILVLALYLWRR